jgi:hypothetical protein
MSTPLSNLEGTGEAHCWQARSLLKDALCPMEARVCAQMRPVHALNSSERWFDELCLWPEGFEVSVSQRARIQAFALRYALRILDRQESSQIGVTISFGTVERYLDHLAEALETHTRHLHRVAVMLRGSFNRLQYLYRLRTFVEYLRILRVPFGYYLTAPRVSMELKALGFLQPDFAKVPAPTMARIERWQDLALEARVAGIPFERFIVAGLDTPQQLSFARQVEIPYGQGSAIAAAQAPPLDEGIVAERMPDPLPQEEQAADESPRQDQRRPTVEGQSWTDDATRLWNVAEAREAGESPADED